MVEAGGGGSFFVAFDGGAGLAFGGAGEDGGEFGGGQLGLGFDGEDIGFELGDGFDAGDEGVDVLGEGEAETLFDLGDFVAGDGAHGVGLHGEDAEAHFAGFGEDVGDEALVVGVHEIDGHLDGFPAVEAAEEFEVDGGVVVAGEADVADFALFFGLDEGFEGAIGAEDLIGFVVAGDLMDLPEVDVIGVEAFELFLESGHGFGFGVFLEFGHQDDLLAFGAGEGFAEDAVAFAFVVVVGGVEEVDAEIAGAGDDAETFLFALGEHVSAAKGKSGDMETAAAEGGGGHGGFGEELEPGGGGEGGGLEEGTALHG